MWAVDGGSSCRRIGRTKGGGGATGGEGRAGGGRKTSLFRIYLNKIEGTNCGLHVAFQVGQHFSYIFHNVHEKHDVDEVSPNTKEGPLIAK